jgi:MFS family permease
MLYWGMIVILEVPMGYIGDRIGRKKTYFFGAILGSFTFLMMILITEFYLLLICWVCWSFFLTIISGTDTAYIYELIKDENLLERSNAIFGYFASITSLSFITSHFFASMLYSVNINLPILVNALCVLAAGILIITLPNPKKEPDDFLIPKMKEVIIDIAWKNKPIRILIFVLALLYAYSWSTTLIFQPFLLDLGVTIEFFGIVYLSFTSLGVIGGLITGKLVQWIGSYYLIIFGTFGMWVAIGLSGFSPSLYALIGIIFIRFFYFLSESPLKVLINDDIDNKYRASIFSLSNLISSLMLLLLRPLIGFFSDILGTRSSFQIWFFLGLMVFILIAYLIKTIVKELRIKLENPS